MITPEQRDAVYDQILDRLSGIGDIWLAAKKEDYDTADRLGREYSDVLRLLSDDLGWGDRADLRAIRLKAPADVLGRAFGRLRESAIGERAQKAPEWIESRKLEERNRLVSEACETVLGELAGEGR